MLEEEEWKFMYEMINILGLFYEATQILSGSTYVTISLIYLIINALKEKNKAASILTQEEPDLELLDDAFDNNIEYNNDDEILNFRDLFHMQFFPRGNKLISSFVDFYQFLMI